MPDDPKDPQPKPDEPERNTFDVKKTANILARQDVSDIMDTVILTANKNPDFAKYLSELENKMPDPATEPKDPPKPAEPAKAAEPKPPDKPEPKPQPPDKPADNGVTDLQKQIHELQLDNARQKAINRYEGLAEDDIAFLVGDTPEAIDASAKALSERYAAKGTAAVEAAKGQEPKGGAPSEPGKKGKAFPADSELPKPTGGPVTIDSVAQQVMKGEKHRDRITREAATEGRRIYESGGPKFAGG